MKRYILGVLLGVWFTAQGFAADPVLPGMLGDNDLADYIGVAITALGGTVVAVIGGFFAVKLVKIGLRLVGRIAG